MNRRWLLLSLAPLVLASCASLPRSVEISREQLQQALDKRFPIERRFLQVIDLQVSGPTVALLPGANRIGVELSLKATDRVSRIPLEGFLAVSFVPRYEATDASIRMSQVRVDRLEIPGAAPSWRSQLERVGALFGEGALEGVPLHTFTPQQIARAQGWAPGELRVTSSGVRMTLVPPR